MAVVLSARSSSSAHAGTVTGRDCCQSLLSTYLHGSAAFISDVFRVLDANAPFSYAPVRTSLRQ